MRYYLLSSRDVHEIEENIALAANVDYPVWRIVLAVREILNGVYSRGKLTLNIDREDVLDEKDGD